jgi:hypothetical protein
MKNLLSCLAIVSFAVCGFSASAAGPLKVVDANAKAAGKGYRVHGALQQNARLVRASVVTAGRAGSAAGKSAAMKAAVEVDDAMEGYDSEALSADHHVRCLIAVEQADAVIYVDGMRAGTSPVEVDWDGRALDKHTLSVRKNGMVTHEQTFNQGVGDSAIYVRLLAAEGQ